MLRERAANQEGQCFITTARRGCTPWLRADSAQTAFLPQVQNALDMGFHAEADA